MFIADKENKDKFTITPQSATQVVSSIEPGLYELKVHRSMFGTSINIHRNRRYNVESMIHTGVYQEVINHIDTFVSEEMYEIREEMGLMHKLGIIMNGGFGTGKTYLACQIVEKLAKEKGALGFITKGEPDIGLADLIDAIRVDNPDQLVILVMDEYEKFNSGESDMLSFLDGSSSRNNVIVIATVNSVKSIPSSIKNRRGRIETIYEFKTESPEVIGKLVDSIVPEKYKDYVDKDKVVKQIMSNREMKNIDNISIHLRDLIYSSLTTVNKKE